MKVVYLLVLVRGNDNGGTKSATSTGNDEKMSLHMLNMQWDQFQLVTKKRTKQC